MLWNLAGILAVGVLLVLLLRVCLRRHVVRNGNVGLLYVAEKYVKVLEPGVYWRVDPFQRDRIVSISTVPTALSASQYEVISKDQFAFRLNLTPLVTITEPREFHEGTPPVDPSLAQYYTGPEMRFARLVPLLSHGVMTEVATRTLEEFLADPAGALEGVREQIAEALPGSRLDRIAITAITLPPEVRKMFTEVERARREGLAGLERAKAEQASLRALANAARNLAGNPQLAQLRVLQTMESAKGAKTFVLGNPSDIVASDPTSQS